LNLRAKVKTFLYRVAKDHLFMISNVQMVQGEVDGACPGSGPIRTVVSRKSVQLKISKISHSPWPDLNPERQERNQTGRRRLFSRVYPGRF
jgi:hypothetical protein